MEAFDGAEQVLSLADLNGGTAAARVDPASAGSPAVPGRLAGTRSRRLPRSACGCFEFGTLAVDGNRLHEAAFPHLQALASRTGLAAQLAILDHAEVVYLERIVVGPIRLPTRRGGRSPAYCTALGKAMAAYNDDAIQTVMAAPMPRKTTQTITEPAALRTELRRIREAGVAYDQRRGLRGAGVRRRADPQLGSGDLRGGLPVTGLRHQDAMEHDDRGRPPSTAAAISNANLNLDRRHPAVTSGTPGHDRLASPIDQIPPLTAGRRPRSCHSALPAIKTWSRRADRGRRQAGAGDRAPASTYAAASTGTPIPAASAATGAASRATAWNRTAGRPGGEDDHGAPEPTYQGFGHVGQHDVVGHVLAVEPGAHRMIASVAAAQAEHVVEGEVGGPRRLRVRALYPRIATPSNTGSAAWPMMSRKPPKDWPSAAAAATLTGGSERRRRRRRGAAGFLG